MGLRSYSRLMIAAGRRSRLFSIHFSRILSEIRPVPKVFTLIERGQETPMASLQEGALRAFQGSNLPWRL